MYLLFSDLHLSAKTLDTCMEVLRRVHSEALARNCPVYFLGDFFDTVYNKGTLPVDILNTLLRFFSIEWKIPLIMLVGNHDMFDAAETEHGLAFLPHTNPLIKVIDEPTRIGDELWVPWRRSVETINHILAENADAKVIFGHFDIIGFKLSHARLSTEGVNESSFPKDVPVYSGHYHTPQGHGNIQYIGSPYQLTLSEAEDQKQFIVLNENYRITETIPVDIGRKQFKWTTSELIQRSSILKKEDRVSITMSEPDGMITKLVEELQSKGIEIVLKQLSKPISTRIKNVGTMTNKELFEEYGNLHSIDKESEAWHDTIEWLSKHRGNNNQDVKRVIPERIQIEGFGPFIGPVNLPLTSNGLTLVSGKNDREDSSNGAGKSLVTAGAWLWAMTGITDGRAALLFGDDKTSIVNKSVGKTSVTVTGTVDRCVWAVTRVLETSPKRKHELYVSLNGTDLTKATIAATQNTIGSNIFGLQNMSSSGLCDWLLRNSVWSQSSVSRWLEVSEAQAKNEIKKIANLTIWEDLFQWSKLELKESKSLLTSHSSTLKMQIQLFENSETQLLNFINRKNKWLDEHQRKIEESFEHLEEYKEKIDPILSEQLIRPEMPPESAQTDLSNLKQLYNEKYEKSIRTKYTMENLIKNLPEKWLTYSETELQERQDALEQIKTEDLEILKDKTDQSFSAYISRNEKYQQSKEALKLFIDGGTCKTCNRTFGEPQERKKHTIKLRSDVESCKEALIISKKKHSDDKKRHEDTVIRQMAHDKIMNEVISAQKYTKMKEIYATLTNETTTIQLDYQKLERALTFFNTRIEVYEKTKELQERALSTLKEKEEAHDALNEYTCPYLANIVQLHLETTTLKEKISKLESDIDKTHQQNAKWTSICKWSGNRGIQTYAMERTVQKLATYNTKWLQIFFNSNDISLEVSFDEKERLHRHFKWASHTGVLSGGQWRRAQLASFMAWRDLGTYQFPLLIMDEACTSMDGEGIRAVQRAFRDWCDEDEARTCFFITHEPDQHRDTSIYDNHAIIQNKRGRASIIESSKRRKLFK